MEPDMTATGPNADQITYWNDKAGPIWTSLQPMLDRQIAPLGVRALAALGPAAGEAILDIGCGCGETTLALAEAAGQAGRVIGLDISAPMLAAARRRAARAGLAQAYFLQADAQTAAFGAKFDAAFSRFGVMFFADPVAAFANIAGGLKPGARLGFVCWRKPAENPWMMLPYQAAAALLPPREESDSLAPGPFAFASADRVRGILVQAGFSFIEISPYDCPIGGFSAADATTLALRVGPLGQALRENPELAPCVAEAVAGALAGYDTEDGVMLESGTWIVTARLGECPDSEVGRIELWSESGHSLFSFSDLLIPYVRREGRRSSGAGH